MADMKQGWRKPFLKGHLLGVFFLVSFLAGPSVLWAEKEDDAVDAIARKPYGAVVLAPTVTEVFAQGQEAPALSAGSLFYFRRSLDRYRWVVAQGGWPVLNMARVLTKNAEGEDVVRLRERLVMEGYLPEEALGKRTFDGEVEAAVVRYQKNNGLYLTGRVGEDTLRVLNIPARDRLHALEVNMARAITYIQDISDDRRILVNIPAAQLETVEGGYVHSRHNVVVGMADRPSPVLQSHVSQINFNPYWHAPVSIVQKDIIPQVMENPLILSQLGIKIYEKTGGAEVDPKTIDWRTLEPDRYLFRQDPGKNNAMATVKISFSNPYSVYMHDTPTKGLFASSERYFSSGCVRVDRVELLVNWVLSRQAGWSGDRVESIRNTGLRFDVEIEDPPEVQFVYLTAWATADGFAHFRPDVYQLDQTSFVSGDPKTFKDLLIKTLSSFEGKSFPN